MHFLSRLEQNAVQCNFSTYMPLGKTDPEHHQVQYQRNALDLCYAWCHKTQATLDFLF